MNRILRWAFAGALALAAAAPASAQLARTIDEAATATSAARASQVRIDRIDDQTGELFREYRATLQRIDSQRLYVEQQRVFAKSQTNEIADLERQIVEVEDVLRNLLPMQIEMIQRLEEFVQLDMPFLIENRMDRVEKLKEYMDDPNIAPAERYRQIVEAYQIEADYGQTLKTWEGPVDPNNPDSATVDYLLIGRVAWVYMSQDESRAGIWDPAAGDWKDLPSGFRLDLRKAIRMAKEVTTPNVFTAPVYAPAAAGGEG